MPAEITDRQCARAKCKDPAEFVFEAVDAVGAVLPISNGAGRRPRTCPKHVMEFVQRLASMAGPEVKKIRAVPLYAAAMTLDQPAATVQVGQNDSLATLADRGIITPEALAAANAIQSEDDRGPFDAATNGICANGHPLNGRGRCEPLIAGDPACAGAAEQL